MAVYNGFSLVSVVFVIACHSLGDHVDVTGQPFIPVTGARRSAELKKILHLRALHDTWRVAPRFGFHTFRHSLATRLMDERESPAVVQAIMRHSKMDMTLYYSHSRRSAKRAAQERVLQRLVPAATAATRVPMRVPRDNSVMRLWDGNWCVNMGLPLVRGRLTAIFTLLPDPILSTT